MADKINRNMLNNKYKNKSVSSDIATVESNLFSWVFKWWPTILLGLVTIGAYGLVLYAFSVFIEPIKAETGWSDGALSGAFSLGLLVSGIGAVFAGHFLDQIGNRPVMLGSLIIGSALLLTAASAGSLFVFIIGWGLGGGIIGAGLFYNVTMAVTTRLYDNDRTKAFAILTFIGGLASPIYFPLAGFLVEQWGWRIALRGQVVLLILCVLPAAILIRGGRAQRKDEKNIASITGYTAIREAFKVPQVRRMVAAFSLMLGAMAAVQVHHIPAMQAVGLSLATATTVAGIRGFLSLPGRALLSPIVNLTGVRGAILMMYAAMMIGLLALLMAGSFFFVLGFAVITGLTYGTILPLHGLYAAEVFGEERIGTLMGAQATVIGLFAAFGPLALGITIDLTGGYSLLLTISVIVTGLAMWLLGARK
jgi:MFS family permease